MTLNMGDDAQRVYKKGGKGRAEMAIRQENNVKGNGPCISFKKKKGRVDRWRKRGGACRTASRDSSNAVGLWSPLLIDSGLGNLDTFVLRRSFGFEL
jgi:hypothetical protein